MSWPRTPTNGLAARVCCAACSRISLSRASAPAFAMAFLRCLCLRIALPDQQAQELGHQGGLRFPLDLQRAVELEQHPPTAVRFSREQACARAHARARLDRCDEADLV